MGHIRKATLDDIDEILSIEKESFAFPWDREAMEGYLASGIFLVYEAQSKVLGYLVALPSSNPIAGRFIRLLNLAVKGSERRKGIASALLNELLALARQEGYKKVLLEVREDNVAALELYRKFGFVPKAKLSQFYCDGGDAFLMELAVERTLRPRNPLL